MARKATDHLFERLAALANRLNGHAIYSEGEARLVSLSCHKVPERPNVVFNYIGRDLQQLLTDSKYFSECASFISHQSQKLIRRFKGKQLTAAWAGSHPTFPVYLFNSLCVALLTRWSLPSQMLAKAWIRASRLGADRGAQTTRRVGGRST